MTVTLPEIAAGFAIAGMLGYAVAQFRSGRSKTQADDATAQRNAIEAMQAQINSQKDTITLLNSQLGQHEAKIEALQTANRVLTDLLQGRPEWAVIAKSLETINKVADMAPTWREEAATRDAAIMDALNVLINRS